MEVKGLEVGIRYQREVVPNWINEVMEKSGCDRIYACIQCGTCSATCPVSHYMDKTPRKIMQLIREGFKEDVLKSFTIWLCASCYSCTVECPMNIKITDVMYALKRMAIEEGYYPRRFPIPVLASEFMKMINKNGRITEGKLAFKIFLKTNPIALLGYIPIGLNLLKKGKFSLKSEKMRDTREIKELLG